MRGSDIILKLGMNHTHDVVERRVFEIDPAYDYCIIRGTGDNPKVIDKSSEEAIIKGRYPRLKIEGREVVSDIAWTTGHHPFEGKVEPRFSVPRPKNYMIK
jgi:hypothetical protein